MNHRVAALARRISTSKEAFENRDDTLLEAHEVIAYARMTGFTPFIEWIELSQVSDEDAFTLRDALIDYIARFPDHDSRVSAYWGLSALHDKKELNNFRRFLEVESTKEIVDENVLWQIMIALDNLEEDILDGFDADLNSSGKVWAASRHYLARHSQN